MTHTKVPAESDLLTLQQTQEALFGLLVVFADFCDEHEIRYSLTGGTLLGAVRHRGFIPWDDDVDVMVPRPDYERLRALSSEAPDGYDLSEEWHDCELGRFRFPFAKFVDRSFRAQEPSWEGVFDEYLWLDVFPVDAFPPDKEQCRKFRAHQRNLIRLASYMSVGGSSLSGAKGLTKRCIRTVLRPFWSPERLYERIRENARRYEGKGYSTCSLLSWVGDSAYPMLEFADFDNLIDLDFSERRFKAISNWDGFLGDLYGDYMQLPPENERHAHGAMVWRID